MMLMPSMFGESLFDDFFDRDFDNMFPPMSASRMLYGKNARNIMKTDVRETDSNYELDVDLPGFKKDEVKLELKDGMLTIRAAKGLDKDEKDDQGRYIRQERYAGACSRSFYVGDGLDPSDVKARFEDGILKISMPRQTPKTLPANPTIMIEG